MANVAFLCPPLPGHINPMATLARTMAKRGHRVMVFGFADMAAKMPADVPFTVFGVDEQGPGSLQLFLDRLSRIGGLFSVRRMIGDLARFNDIICRLLPEALEGFAPDAMIVDQADPASSLVARALDIPFANVANALPLNREDGVPPPVLPWPYDAGEKGIRRNRGGYRVARLIERPITKVIRKHAIRLGQHQIRFAEDCWSDRCQVTQCVRGLDFPRNELPDSFHYTGPFREPDAPLDFDLPDNGRPLAFCSLGTLQGGRGSIFRSVAEAADALGLQLLIAHGGLLHDREIERLPGSPIVRAFVPQRAVLARSALAITHAGLNTVMDALSFGVPMVAMPLAFEQPGTAARLARVGAAEVVQGRRTRTKVQEAMATVLKVSRYGEAASKLAEEIAVAGGVERAADLIGSALGLSARPAAATMGHAG